jgi:hypothetical protein
MRITDEGALELNNQRWTDMGEPFLTWQLGSSGQNQYRPFRKLLPVL